MEKIIKAAVERGASDLHIKAGDVFRARIHGKLVPLTKQRLAPDQTRAIALKLLSSEEDRGRLDQIKDFDWAQTRHDLVLRSPSGRSYEILMYTTDGLRLEPRSPGLDHRPRMLEGAFDLTAAAAESGEGELSDLIRTRFGGRAIFEIWVQATIDELVVSPAQFFVAPLGTLRRP